MIAFQTLVHDRVAARHPNPCALAVRRIGFVASCGVSIRSVVEYDNTRVGWLGNGGRREVLGIDLLRVVAWTVFILCSFSCVAHVTPSTIDFVGGASREYLCPVGIRHTHPTGSAVRTEWPSRSPGAHDKNRFTRTLTTSLIRFGPPKQTAPADARCTSRRLFPDCVLSTP